MTTAHDRYMANQNRFKLINLRNYYKKLLLNEDIQNDESRLNRYQTRFNELTEQLSNTPHNPAPPRQHRELTTQQMYPQYTKLVQQRHHLINVIKNKQFQQLPFDNDKTKLFNIVKQIEDLPTDMKPTPKPFTVKARNNIQFIESLRNTTTE